MALTGQLSDMSLAELIEFFCNQKKTGRLKIDYPRGHSLFFIKDGELVDARVGALSGPEAVYFSLTLPNAAFDFSPDVHPTRQTINDSWTHVVLEGLRRLDEGISPTEADAFNGWTPSDADVTADRLGDMVAEAAVGKKAGKADAPLSLMVDSASDSGDGKKKWIMMGAGAAVLLICAAVAIPLSGRLGGKPASAAAPAGAAKPSAPAPSAPAQSNEVAQQQPDGGAAAAGAPAEAAPGTEAAGEEAAAAARREREAREARERRDRRAEELARRNAEAGRPLAPAAAPAAGPKSVRVSVSYDEQGRVTQASVAGATPGAEAYGGTAVRIARGRRFPTGKPGATVVTIPIN